MQLYVYHYDCKTKTIEKAEVWVVEKPKTYKVPNGSFPHRYVSIISKEEVDGKEINKDCLTYISKSPDMAVAVRKFRKYWGDQMETAKRNTETYEGYYGSCFAYQENGKGVMVP
jgi:hypothetical protein